jgi:hypothetical protein
LESFITNDDGIPFTAVINLAYREELDYADTLAEGVVAAATSAEAISTLASSFFWIAAQYATVPLLVMDYQGHMYRAQQESEDEVRCSFLH